MYESSIRSLPLTGDVVRPGNPDFAKIRALVRKGLQQTAAAPSTSASSSPKPSTTSKPKPATPTPTATPDDSQAVSLAATC